MKKYTRKEFNKLIESMTMNVLAEIENQEQQQPPQPPAEEKVQTSAPHLDPKKQLIMALKELKHAISELNESELVKGNAQMLKMLPKLSGMTGKVIGYCKTNLLNKPAPQEQPQQEDETSQEIANTKI